MFQLGFKRGNGRAIPERLRSNSGAKSNDLLAKVDNVN